MVGQRHVVRALMNGLDKDTLHHAFLFTGTRGVGKTTVARILAKCLNCEEGVSSTPCGVCTACRELDEGRFVDLIEVDAASKARVEETRELMDNVQFMPTQGRYKVYLMDEVHMFSGHSFNALLKTLEEPPPHVKFLLATTDPRKLPVTVVSRCLRFNLKRLPVEEIAGQLDRILQEEGIVPEPGVTRLLAVAADGSMRDGLSLLDQTIAYCGGALGISDVKMMLGTVDRGHIHGLLTALAAREGDALMAGVAAMAGEVTDFDDALCELLRVLQRVAMIQVVPGAVGEADPDDERARTLAGAMSPEDVQLYYQIALMGRRDLPFSPDPRTGFEMIVLRMLAFRPVTATAPGPTGGGRAPKASEGGGAAGSVGDSGDRGPIAPHAPAPHPPGRRSPEQTTAATGRFPGEPLPRESAFGDPASDGGTVASEAAVGGAGALEGRFEEPPPDDWMPDGAMLDETAARGAPGGRSHESPPRDPASGKGAVAGNTAVRGTLAASPENWHRIVAGLELTGVTKELAVNCALMEREGDRVHLRIDPAHAQLLGADRKDKLENALRAYWGDETRLTIEVLAPDAETPAAIRERRRDERHQGAVRAIDEDPTVQALCATFDARIEKVTINE